MTMTDARANLLHALRLVVDAVQLQVFTKARDKREPGRNMKQDTEKQLAEALAAYFRKQARAIRAQLQQDYPDRKAAPAIDVPDEFDEELERELIMILVDAEKKGITLFGQQVALGIDYTIANTRAAQWAREHVGELIRGINDTTRAAIRAAVAMFAETPGITVGDVVSLMPFDEQRAWRVAVTETTRAYAQANRIAGDRLKEEWPDVRVVKTWFTNYDDLTCDICRPLNEKQVEIDEDFDPGISEPPAHPNCRCWISTRTKITGD